MSARLDPIANCETHEIDYEQWLAMVCAKDSSLVQLVEALPLPVQMISPHGDVVHENLAYRSTFGKPAEVAESLAAALRGGRSSAIRAAMNGIERVVPLGSIGGASLDARYFPIRDAAGTVSHVGIVFVEVREMTVSATPRTGRADRSEVEQSVLNILDRMPQLVWSTRPDGYHDFYNQRWYEYTGADPVDTRGAGWNDPLHPDDQQRAWERWAHSLQTGEDYEIEYRFRGADGNYRWFLGRALPMRDESGSIVRWFGTCTDVDDQKRLEQQRVEVLAQAEANSRMKDEFLATISHELRTPLTAILGWTQMLRARPELAPKANEVIERNARAQAKLIEDVLETSRIVTGKVQLSLQAGDLTDIVQAAVDTIRPTSESKGVTLDVSLEQGLPRMVCDPDRLGQVVLNLLVNAVKFTPAGGRVDVRTFATEKGQVGLTVSDTGKGIAASFLPFVFDRFRQADSSITRRHGGLGLGLAIAKHFVELHSGTIGASSEGEGKGATIEIRLPIKAISAMATGDRMGREALPRPALATRLDNLHVLVVDDEPDARELVAMVLREAGAETTEADSASGALEAIDRGPVDVLVSDIGMPIQDGYCLLRAIRSRAPGDGGRVPAIALTAFTRGEDVERAREAGFQMHLAKPVEPSDLVAAVHQLSSMPPGHGAGRRPSAA